MEPPQYATLENAEPLPRNTVRAVRERVAAYARAQSERYVVLEAATRGIAPLHRGHGEVLEWLAHRATCSTFRGREVIGTAGIYEVPRVVLEVLPRRYLCRVCLVGIPEASTAATVAP